MHLTRANHAQERLWASCVVPEAEGEGMYHLTGVVYYTGIRRQGDGEYVAAVKGPGEQEQWWLCEG
jgi:hypothetical protein